MTIQSQKKIIAINITKGLISRICFHSYKLIKKKDQQHKSYGWQEKENPNGTQVIDSYRVIFKAYFTSSLGYRIQSTFYFAQTRSI